VNVVGSSVFVNNAASAATAVGRNLQVATSVRLQNAPPSAVDITLSVPAGSGVLLSSSATAAGAETLVIPAVADASNRTIYVQGTALGATTVTASAPGYMDGALAVSVTPSGFAFYLVSTDPVTVDAFAPNQNVGVWSVRLNDAGAFQAWQNTRGGATFEVPVTSSNAAAGTIINSPLVFTSNTNFVNATFDPIAAGSTLVAITQPAGFTATTTANSNARPQYTVNVVGSSVFVNNAASAATAVGRNLQVATSVRLQNAPPSAVDITLSVPAGSGVLLSSSATAAGAETLVIPAVADASNRTIYVQGTALGATTVAASAPGYMDGALAVSVTPSGFAFYLVSTDPVTVDAFAPNQNVGVWSVRLNDAGAFQAWQNTRGGATFEVPVTSSNAAAGTIINSPLVFTSNTNFVNATFDPIAAGSTLVAITQPAGFTATTTANSNARSQYTVNVVGSSVFVNNAASAATAVGRNLQVATSVRLQNAPPSAVDITLSVPAGSGVLLSSSATAAGAETLVIPAVADASNRTIYVQGTALGATTVAASAPGYMDGALAVSVTPSGFAFYLVSTDPVTVDAFAPNQNVGVWSVRLNDAGAFQAWQNTRGGATFEVPVTSSNAAAGTIINSPLVFTSNTNFVNATFDPIAAGSTLVAITQPAGFTATTTANSNARSQYTVNVTSSSPGGVGTFVNDQRPGDGLTSVAAQPAAPTIAAPATATLSKAELKRLQRIEKAQQRAAQQEAKRALRQARRNGGTTQAGAPAASPAPGSATVPVQPAASRPPD
jgi:hypothetical protein